MYTGLEKDKNLDQIDQKSKKRHVIAAILGVIINPLVSSTFYFDNDEIWLTDLFFRLCASIIILTSLIFWRKKKIRSYTVVLITFLLISIQDSWMYSVIGSEQLMEHTLNSLLLTIGASLFVLWPLTYSIFVAVISLLSIMLSLIHI